MENHESARVALDVDGRREFAWTSRDASMVAWRVGEIVSFRNCEWEIVERAEDEAGSVTFTLTCTG